MRVGDDGILPPFGASIMANAVCENGPKCIPVDSAPGSFSLSEPEKPGLRCLKKSNEPVREFRYAMQINRPGYFKHMETIIQ